MNMTQNIANRYLPALLLCVGLLAAQGAAAQGVTFECKQVDDWKPMVDDRLTLGPMVSKLPGRCDVTGKLQGESVAMLVDRFTRGYVRANFVDGRPQGPAVLVAQWQDVVSGNRGLRCTMSFLPDGRMGNEIACKEPGSNNDPQPVSFKFTSPSGFGVSSVNNRDARSGVALTAADVLVEADGSFWLELRRDRRTAQGRLSGLTNLTSIPLAYLVSSSGFVLTNGKFELTGSINRGVFDKNGWLKSVSGPFRVANKGLIELTPWQAEDLSPTLRKRIAESGHPVSFEVTAVYDNGYTATFIPLYGHYVYYKDSRGLEFSGLIPECFAQGRQPGVLRMNDTWPLPYLGTNTERTSIGFTYTATGNMALPSGCGSFKAEGTPQMRGDFKGENTISFKPF